MRAFMTMPYTIYTYNNSIDDDDADDDDDEQKKNQSELVHFK